MGNTSLYHDPQFRRIVVASTGFGLACMLGSVASLRISAGAGLEFIWHWSILLLAGAVMVWNRRLWNLLWEIQDRPAQNSRKLAFHLTLLLLLGLGAFLYPIRFIEQSHWNGILKGLVTAAIFLGTMFWLIYRVAKSLEQDSARSVEAQ